MIQERTAPVNVVADSSDVNRSFLPYLEGIRGFFCIYFALAHAWMRMNSLRPDVFVLPPHFVAFSHNWVAIFMFVSGYVLGAPVVKNGQTFRGGLGRYARRRALRILPAYYAALVLAIPISLLVTPGYREALSSHEVVMSVLLHAALLHNVSDPLIMTVDNPMWSIAVEWDIYILFPLVLVPLVRRFGFVAMIVAAFAIGLLPTFVGALRHAGPHYRLGESCFWYLGIFALGYAAATIIADRRPAVMRCFETWPWQQLAIGFAVANIAVIVNGVSKAQTNSASWLADMLIGFAVAAQFLANARANARGRATLIERFFAWRPLLFVGTFSYSFYLVHLPVIDLVMSIVRPTWLPAQIVMLGLATFVAALIVAYAFYRAFERPFMSAYRRRGDEMSLREDARLSSPGAPAPSRSA